MDFRFELSISYSYVPQYGLFLLLLVSCRRSCSYGQQCNLKIVGMGTILIKMHDGVIKTITDVKHIHDLKKNIISLGVLDLNGCKIRIEPSEINVFHGVLIVMRGKKIGSLSPPRSKFTGSTTISSFTYGATKL